MTEAFKIISEFLQQSENDVLGHESQRPNSETMEEIARFARGELTAQDRLKIMRALEQNPSWITLLANEIKAGRMKQDGE